MSVESPAPRRVFPARGPVAMAWCVRRSAPFLASILAWACVSPPVPGPARGEAVFATCAPCHGANGEGNVTLRAPSIAGAPEWYVRAQLVKFQGGIRGAHPDDTVGIRMRSMSLAIDLDGDLESVAGHVASLPVSTLEDHTEGDANAGSLTYLPCAGCHGTDGSGNEALGAPPLVGQSGWYLVAQLRKFKSGWRGTHPADVSGATMRASALALDESAMHNVVAYIETLR